MRSGESPLSLCHFQPPGSVHILSQGPVGPRSAQKAARLPKSSLDAAHRGVNQHTQLGEELLGGTSGKRASPGGCVAEKWRRKSIALRSQGFPTPLLSFPHFPTASLGVDFRCNAFPFPWLAVSEGGVFVSSC